MRPMFDFYPGELRARIIKMRVRRRKQTVAINTFADYLYDRLTGEALVLLMGVTVFVVVTPILNTG